MLPVGSPEQVRAGWVLHSGLVRRALERGYYQGWDLHPAQLPSRFAATYAFYRPSADPADAPEISDEEECTGVPSGAEELVVP